jgi:hypothetical protein
MDSTVTSFTPEQIDRLARRRAGAKMGWYIHAMVYVVVNAVLLLMAQLSFGNRPWTVFPVLGWGLGLALHGLAVFVLGGGSSWRQRLVDRERERLQREQDRDSPR